MLPQAVSIISLKNQKTPNYRTMPDLNTTATQSKNYLGGYDSGLGQVPVDPAMLASVAKSVPGIAKDVMNFAECIFAPKTCRNRKRREVRDKMMQWLYSKGVHKVNDTGRDGRYNDSIQKLVGLVQQDPDNGVRIINQYLGQTITPAAVTNVVKKYNDYVKSVHPEYGSGSGSTSVVPASGGSTTPAGAATTTSSIKSSLPILVVGSVAVAGIGTAIFIATRKKND